MNPVMKKELLETGDFGGGFRTSHDAGERVSFVDLSSSSDSDDGEEDDGFPIDANGSRSAEESGGRKRQKIGALDIVLPAGFLDPLPPPTDASMNSLSIERSAPVVSDMPISKVPAPRVVSCRQFWKAGDYERDEMVKSESILGMEHVRVHPKFLHSNATSHKWALGAFAELLDNSLDEVCNGATYVKLDMLMNRKDGSKMLLIEDDGGGMDLDKMRQCMSLGYSVKSKLANTIGQYGNGFKTSTMRLGADVIVFSRCPGKDEKSSTQSIGLLSYTFLRSTGKEDIVVPMVDYERVRQNWKPMVRASQSDWSRTLETIIQWSPYTSESDLLQQFSCLKGHGTRIVIYNLWEDDQGELELDFDADPYDIQLRGVNRDEKKIQMAKRFPNSRHFLTYQHSLRSYASIIYLRLPAGFRMILRGKEVEHHSLVQDMMLKQEITYKPQTDGIPKEANMVAVVTIGFVKDAKDHIDIQGFNVYHKNRLIKPFWRIWNAAGSDGRGVIGVLEANFVEPAHDKQGFERTIVLSRLEARLIQMQKTYWSSNCHKVGYAPRRNKKFIRESSPDSSSPEPPPSKQRKKSLASIGSSSRDQSQLLDSSKNQHLLYLGSSESLGDGQHSRHASTRQGNGNLQSSAPASSNKGSPYKKSHASVSMDKFEKFKGSWNAHGDGDHSQHGDDDSDHDGSCSPVDRGRVDQVNASVEPNDRFHDAQIGEAGGANGRTDASVEKGTKNSLQVQSPKMQAAKRHFIAKLQNSSASHENGPSLSNSGKEGEYLGAEDRLKASEEKILRFCQELQFERDRNRSLEVQVQEYKQKLEEARKEQESLIDIFSEERSRRDREEETLRKKLKDACTTIQELLQKNQNHEVKSER